MMDRKDSLLELAEEAEAADGGKAASESPAPEKNLEQPPPGGAGNSSRARKNNNLRRSLESATLGLSYALGGSGEDHHHHHRRRQRHGECDVDGAENRERHVMFHPMSEMFTYGGYQYTPSERRRLWWENPADFNEFRTVNQFIGRASLDREVRMWMAHYYHPTGYQGDVYDDSYHDCYDGLGGGGGPCGCLPCPCLRPPGTAPEPSPFTSPKPPPPPPPDVDVADEKWWHQYGHSRRGLENIGTAEGMERLAQINATRRAVVNWYRTQKMAHGKADPVKLSIFYRRRTLWARDLALAAGRSDADAVRKEFDDEARHSREYYIAMDIVRGTSSCRKEDALGDMPAFMAPPGLLNRARRSIFGDKRPGGSAEGGVTQNPEEQEEAAVVVPSSPPSPEEEVRNNKKKTAVEEAVVPLKDGPRRSSDLAKKAASLGAGGASMGAVLSGMGSSSSSDKLNA